MSVENNFNKNKKIDEELDITILLPIGSCQVRGDRDSFEIKIYTEGKTFLFHSLNGQIISAWKTGMIEHKHF